MTVVLSRSAGRRKSERDGALLRKGWRLISEYRKDMGYVVVLGDSRCISTPYQSAIAIKDEQYCPQDPWVDHAGERLTTRGLVPSFFSTDLPNED